MAGDKTDSARVRVEGVMREEANLEMMEILDLFLELLIVRIPLIESSKDLPQAGRVTKRGSWRMGPGGGGSLLDLALRMRLLLLRLSQREEERVPGVCHVTRATHALPRVPYAFQLAALWLL